MPKPSYSSGTAPSHAEQHAPVEQMVEQRDLLGHTQRFVPREDHRAGAEPDALRPRRHVREEHGVVGTERVVVEVVLDRPQRVEAEFVREHAEADLVRDHLPVADLSRPPTTGRPSARRLACEAA